MSKTKRSGRALWTLLLAAALTLTAGTVSAAENRVLPRASVPMHDVYHNESDQVYANRGTLPLTWNSVKKKYITPVKDQGTYGTCSYHASIAAIESSAIRSGVLKRKGLDLSEYHLFYFFNHRVADPLGLTKGDYTEVMGDQLVLGGNINFNGFHMLTWSGPAKESKVKFDTSTWSTALKKSLAYKDALHVEGMLFQPMYDRSGVKELIMKYGSVAVTYYSDPLVETDYCNYYNRSTGAYYYNGAYDYTLPNIGNHSVTLVGWNDKYSRTNFRAGNQPSRDGAWLVKNQWGTDFGNKGYFWISYEDILLHQNDSYNVNMAVAYQVGKASNYDYNYQYDGGTGVYYANPVDKMTMTNVYKTAGAANQSLRAVGFGTYSDNVKYSIQIYRNPKKGKPMSGTKLFKTPQTGTLAHAGFVTIPLKKAVSLKKGQSFSVSITVSSSSGNATFLVDQNIPPEVFNWVKVTAKQKSGQSYYTGYSGSYSWTDDTSAAWYSYTPRIKAYTVKK